MNSKKDVIYILTNPSFEEYVKIGYATNIEERLKQLNRSEAVPFAFRVYAVYEVEKELSDKILHGLIDKLDFFSFGITRSISSVQKNDCNGL